MKRFYAIAATASIIVFQAAAQDEAGVQRFKVEADRVMAQVRTMTVNGLVMGPAVKGAPYAATEISENTQTLADGTRIHSENQTQVYRDSEGRVRRETPTQVTIWDPVENTSYILNPKNQTARQVRVSTASLRTGEFQSATFAVAVPPPGDLPRMTVAHGEGPAVNYSYEVRTDTIDGRPADKIAAERAAADKMKVEAVGRAGVMIRSGPSRVDLPLKSAKEESLGKQSIVGVVAEGSRSRMVLEVGAIGNDRPIETINERWYSSELQTVVMTKHSDPRTGEEVFRLANVNRSEPPAYLFQVPAGYQLIEQK